VELLEEYPDYMRAGKTLGGGRIKGFTASDLNCKRQAMDHMVGALLSRLDVSPNGSLGQGGEFDKVEAFAVGYFKDIPKHHY
jgi:hypothetical protein